MVDGLDRDLVSGLLAYRIGFIERTQLLNALRVCNSHTIPLGEWLVQQDLLDAVESDLLQRLTDRRIQRDGGSLREAVASLDIDEAITEELSRKSGELDSTLALEADSSTSPGEAAKRGEAETLPTAATASADIVGPESTTGRFRLVRSLAKGGLGEVSIAVDEELDREVALKQIQARFAGDPSRRRRFLLEAQVTGRLEHPGIVPVYGLGKDPQGNPYYAMRFIEGESLKQAAERFHHAARSDVDNRDQAAANDNDTADPDASAARVSVTDGDRDFTGVEFRRLLGRFVDVCQAIEYAHSRGVLHRDLKPSNIMLGPYGETLVVDWGLAKVKHDTEDSNAMAASAMVIAESAAAQPEAVTQVGTAMGTPAFMPPEQSAGDVEALGPRSDVYALGATLYFLLTGQTAFDGGDLPALLQQVQEGRFESPRAVVSTVPRPLEAICLYAMARKPDERYASALSLAEDVERFLADEAVSAFDEPVAVRVRRWMRKHQTLTVSTAATLLVAILGLGVFSSVVSGKNAQLQTLNGQLRQTNTELAQSEQRESLARQQAEANEATAREQSQLALSTLTAVVHDVQAGLQDVPGGAETRRRLTLTALEKLERVSREYVSHSVVDHSTFRALLEMGDIINAFGTGDAEPDSQEDALQQTSLALAEMFFSRALEIGEKLRNDENATATMYRRSILPIGRLAGVDMRRGKIRDAIQKHQQQLRHYEQMIEAFPHYQLAKVDATVSLVNLGSLARRQGELGEAREYYEEAGQLVEELAESGNDSTELRVTAAKVAHGLARIGLEQGDPAKAEQYALEALAIQRQILTEDEDSGSNRLNVAESLALVGDLAMARGDIGKARTYYVEMADNLDRFLESEPTHIEANRLAHVVNHRLGKLNKLQQDWTAAWDSYSRALQSAQQLATRDPDNLELMRNLAIASQNLGDVRAGQQRFPEAEELHRKRLEIARQMVEVAPEDARARRDLSIAHERLGQIHLLMGDAERALPFLEARHDIALELAKADPTNATYQQDVSISYQMLGTAHGKFGDYAKGLDLLEEALVRARKSALDNPQNASAHRGVMVCLYDRGKMQRAAGNYEAAAQDFEAAADVLRRMVNEGMNVQASRMELEIMEQETRNTRTEAVAMGDWDELLQEPVDRLPLLLALRTRAMLEAERPKEAVRAADRLLQAESESGSSWFTATSILVGTIASLEAGGWPETHGWTREQWVSLALQTLQKAVNAGFDDIERIRGDEDFDVLKDEPEFQAILEMLE